MKRLMNGYREMIRRSDEGYGAGWMIVSLLVTVTGALSAVLVVALAVNFIGVGALSVFPVGVCLLLWDLGGNDR